MCFYLFIDPYQYKLYRSEENEIVRVTVLNGRACGLKSGDVMKILFAADGSTFTTKALTFLVTNKTLIGEADELVVLNVQDAISAQIERKLGSPEITAFQTKQADVVLEPIKTFLDQHDVKYRCIWVAGSAADQIIEASKREQVQMIVMGTHGHGLLSRMFMGSVAQRVLADSQIPTLLVK